MPNTKALGFQRFSCQSAPILCGRVLVLDARELLQEVVGVLQLQVFFWVHSHFVCRLSTLQPDVPLLLGVGIYPCSRRWSVYGVDVPLLVIARGADDPDHGRAGAGFQLLADNARPIALPLHGGHVDGGDHRGDVRRVLGGTELEVEGLHDFELVID